MHQDELKITILDDGRLRVETDTVSPANHLGADELLAFLSRLLGGETLTQPKAHAHTHTHRGQQASH